MHISADLDHTKCLYEIVTRKPVSQPQRLNMPGLHPLISDASGSQMATKDYDDAIFNACKAVEGRVQALTGHPKNTKGVALSGKGLMTTVFNEQSPTLDITSGGANEAQKGDEREGFKYLFMGVAQALRNPRGHGPNLQTTEHAAMEMLATTSMLMRFVGSRRIAESRTGTAAHARRSEVTNTARPSSNDYEAEPVMAVSKRLRFEVLRRDNHACRYCGATPPDVVLTIDHVVQTALGGGTTSRRILSRHAENATVARHLCPPTLRLLATCQRMRCAGLRPCVRSRKIRAQELEAPKELMSWLIQHDLVRVDQLA